MENSAINKKEVSSKFEQLCNEANLAWDTNVSGTFEHEPYLLCILNYVKQNISMKGVFSEKFIDLLSDKRAGSKYILVFCMRELQWPEINEKVNQLLDEEEDFRVVRFLSKILEVYEDEWPDSDLYKYYDGK